MVHVLRAVATPIPALGPLLNPLFLTLLLLLFSSKAVDEGRTCVEAEVWLELELSVENAVDCTFQPTIGIARIGNSDSTKVLAMIYEMLGIGAVVATVLGDA